MSTISQSATPSATAPAPTRKRATSSIGFCVADRPMRVSGVAHSALQPLERQRQMAAALARRRPRGSRRRSPCAPSTACARPDSEPSSTYSDSGVVTRMCGGLAQALLALALRRVAGAHGGADLDVGQAQRAQLGADAGQRRFEVEADVVGQRLQRRDVDDRGLVGQRRRAAGPGAPARRCAARNAVSVLPEPVGAATSVWRPARIAGHAAACASVGAAKRRLNQPPTAGWKASRDTGR